MSEPTREIMKCPGCQQMIDISKYNLHMAASTQIAHSDVGVIPIKSANTPYPVMGAEPPKPATKHFLKRWADLWKKDSYGMMTFGFFMFGVGLVVEWYYYR